jgi:acyl dehydratase
MICSAADARRLDVGSCVRSSTEAPITRVEIAWYMVASYDLNPIHVDEPFARAAGFDTVIGQGMLPLGYLARLLVAEVGLERVTKLGGDFVGPVFPGDALSLELTLAARHEVPGGVELEWALAAVGPDGKKRVRGHARSRHDELERA